LQQQSVELSRCAQFCASLHAVDAVVAPGLDYLAVDGRDAERRSHNTLVELEPVGRDQRETPDLCAVDGLIENACGVSIRASADDTCRPQA